MVAKLADGMEHQVGPRYAPDRGPRYESDQPPSYHAAAPLGQWTDGADKYQRTLRLRPPRARSWSHEQPLLGSDSDSADWS